MLTPDGDIDGDLHEFRITEDGTALVTGYEITTADLSSLGKSQKGWIYDAVIQEIDIETGELIFQWRASNFYAVDDTFTPIGDRGSSKDNPFDYFHLNSIDKDPQGNYYVSSRYLHTVTCINSTGEVIWVLGGKRNSFTDVSGEPASYFSWQHNAKWHLNSVLTVFDNGRADSHVSGGYSRGLSISLNLQNMTSSVLQVYENPHHLLSPSQGSMQVIPETGNILIGWGHIPAYTEYTADGETLCDIHFGAGLFFEWGWVKSYRVFKGAWTGRPSIPPDVDVYENMVFISWNGATEVTGWMLECSSYPHALDEEFESILFVPKDGFETVFDLPDELDSYFRIAALDSGGQRLGYTKVFDSNSGQAVSTVSCSPPPLSVNLAERKETREYREADHLLHRFRG